MSVGEKERDKEWHGEHLNGQHTESMVHLITITQIH